MLIEAILSMLTGVSFEESSSSVLGVFQYKTRFHYGFV